ncbi:ribonuclease Y [mine drainage metagenome]|uniref:Ribonuclease Y n=1 Tax=mine drainage metagenome TaxID=410659 RepID=A0A1J5R413_9ZZZZ
MTQIAPEIERKLGIVVERMPAFPKSVQKILEITRNINCTPRELVGIIEKDPVITLKVLRVVNSAQLSLPTKITSINQSVVYLGVNTIKNLALSIAAIGILPATNAAGFDIQRYLMHSLTTAAFARQLCSVYAAGEADPGDCYIAGLLHDFGKIVFAQFMPEQFRQVLARSAETPQPSHHAELELIGADHTVVGAMLADKWQFPAALVDSIRSHHSPDAPATAMNDCLRMADLISRKLGDVTNPYREGESPINPVRFGTDLARVVAALGDTDRMTAEATNFAQAGMSK